VCFFNHLKIVAVSAERERERAEIKPKTEPRTITKQENIKIQ